MYLILDRFIHTLSEAIVRKTWISNNLPENNFVPWDEVGPKFRYAKQANKPTETQNFSKCIYCILSSCGCSYIFHGLLYSQKKIILAMDFSQRLLQESLRTNLKIHLSFSPFYQFSRSLFQALRWWEKRERVEDEKEKGGRKGRRGGKKGKRRFPRSFFSCLHFLNSTDPTISEPGTCGSDLRQQSLW